MSSQSKILFFGNDSRLTLALLKVGGVEKIASLYSPTWNSLNYKTKKVAPRGLMSALMFIASRSVNSETYTGRPIDIINKMDSEKSMQNIFIFLGSLCIVYGLIYFIYLLDDLARLTGLLAVPHPQHIKMLVQNAQKFEITNIQPDSDHGTKKMV